jgi:hypothetical protein
LQSTGSKRLLCGLLLFAFAARATEPPPPPPDELPAPARVPAPALTSAYGEPSWTLRVHLLTEDERVELRRVADNALICKAPCGQELQFHQSDEFVLRGKGLSPSPPFLFSPREGDVSLRVQPASAAPRFAGGVLVAGGAAAAAIGGLYALAEAAASICMADSNGCTSHADQVQTGAIVALAGLGAAAIGLLILLSTHPTTYSVEE